MTTVHPTPRRRYHSPSRAARAAQTRHRIIVAAQDAFLERGYVQTTLGQVARAAGVAPDTVYKVFGSKIQLLKELLDEVVGGDDQPVAVLDRLGPQALRREPDQHRQLALLAAGVTEQLERIRPLDDVLLGAAAVDGQAAELRAEVQDRQRRSAMTTIVGWVADRGPLREGAAGRAAADTVWVLTSGEVHRMLRDVAGLSAEDYRNWLEDQLVCALLPSTFLGHCADAERVTGIEPA